MKSSREIIVRPYMTEKVSMLQETDNKIAFVVDRDANKIEIRKAVESKFNVQVKKVSTINLKGKIKRMGRFQGRRPNWKKAIVTLQEGSSIDFFEGK